MQVGVRVAVVWLHFGGGEQHLYGVCWHRPTCFSSPQQNSSPSRPFLPTLPSHLPPPPFPPASNLSCFSSKYPSIFPPPFYPTRQRHFLLPGAYQTTNPSLAFYSLPQNSSPSPLGTFPPLSYPTPGDAMSFSPGAYQIAALAAGGAMQLVDAVMSATSESSNDMAAAASESSNGAAAASEPSKAANGGVHAAQGAAQVNGGSSSASACAYGLVRPPGHHAERSEGMG